MDRGTGAQGCRTEDHVSAVLSQGNSQEDAPSNIGSMSEHTVSLHTGASCATLGCPPRAFIQAQHSARKWILDIFHSSDKVQDIKYESLVPLWGVFEAIASDCCEMKELEFPTKTILRAAATAARSAAGSSSCKDLLCCCGEYLFLLSVGNIHALMAPILKMCYICFSCKPCAPVDEDSRPAEVLTTSGADLLQSATQVALKTGGSSQKQLSVQLQGVLHHALPLAHAPESRMLHVAPKHRKTLAQQISETLRTLTLQPALLQHAVQDLQLASSEQAIAELIGSFQQQCIVGTELLSQDNEAADAQLSDKYLENMIFDPWKWLEQQSSGKDLEQWQSALVSCLPEHAHWLMRVCSSSIEGFPRKNRPAGRSRKGRWSINDKQERMSQWRAFLAILHRSTLSTHRILSSGNKTRKKKSKSGKQGGKGNAATDRAALLALEGCAMAIRACGEQKVYVPAEDATGIQRAALKQFAQFQIGLWEAHSSPALQCGVAAVLAELAPLDHSIVTENVHTCLQLSWPAVALTDDASEPEGTGLLCKLIAAFSSLRDLRSLLDSIFLTVLETCPAGAEEVLLSDHVHEALATAAHQAPPAQASRFIECVARALERASQSSVAPKAGQLRCICSIAASVLSSIPVSQVVQVTSVVHACKDLMSSMQGVVEACCSSGRSSRRAVGADCSVVLQVACLPLLRVQAVAWHLHSSCAALDPSIPAQPASIKLPLNAIQELSNSGAATAATAAESTDPGAESTEGGTAASWCSKTRFQASVTLRKCSKDASQPEVPPFVCALLLWGCHALVDGARLPFKSVVDAHLGCAACCVQLTRHYENAMLQPQYSVACEKGAMGQPDDAEPSAGASGATPRKALKYISTLAGLLFIWSSSQAHDAVWDTQESPAVAVDHAKAAAEVQQLLQQAMPSCIRHMSSPVRQLVIEVCVKRCSTGPTTLSNSPYPHVLTAVESHRHNSEHTLPADSDSGTRVSEAPVVQQSAAAAALEVLRRASCTAVLGTLISTSSALCQELCEAVQRLKAASEGRSTFGPIQAVIAACMSCMGSVELNFHAGLDSAHSWGLLDKACGQFLRSCAVQIVPDGAAKDGSTASDSTCRDQSGTRESEEGLRQSVAHAMQHIQLYTSLTASLLLRGAADTDTTYPQRVLQSVVACLVSISSCSMLMHCMGWDRERDAGLHVVCGTLSWLAEACTSHWECQADFCGAPAALSKWLEVCARIESFNPQSQRPSVQNSNSSMHPRWVAVTCQLRASDLLAYIAKQSLQAQDSKKCMKKLLKSMHPQLHTKSGTKRKRSPAQQEDGDDEESATARVSESVLPLLFGVVHAVHSECSKSGGEGIQPGAQVALHAVRQACDTFLMSQQRGDMQLNGTLNDSSEGDAAQVGTGACVGGDKGGLTPWVGQLHVVQAQLACCSSAAISSDEIIERLQDSIDCAEACVAAVGSTTVNRWQVQKPQLLQLLSAIEAYLYRLAELQPASAHEAASKVVQLCLACLQAAVLATPQQPMQCAGFQAAAHVLQVAYEVTSSHESHSVLHSVLQLLDCTAPRGHSAQKSRVHGETGALCGFTALLLLLECSSPAVGHMLAKHAVAVFQSVVAGLHANVIASCGNSDARVNAATSLALRCMESMCAQKRTFKPSGPVLHHVTSCVATTTAALMLQVQAATTHAPTHKRESNGLPRQLRGKEAPTISPTTTSTPTHKPTHALHAVHEGGDLGAGVVQVLGGCCSLITALLRHRPEAAEATTAALPWLSQQCIDCIACFANSPASRGPRRQELVDAVAAAVGGVWEAAAGCNAGKGYLPLLLQGYLRVRCASAPGEDAMRWGALQLVGALSDTQLQQAHRQAMRHDKTGLAAQVLAELRAEFGKRFKYTGKL